MNNDSDLSASGNQATGQEAVKQRVADKTFKDLKDLLLNIEKFVDQVDWHTHLRTYRQIRRRRKDDRPPQDDRLINEFRALVAQFQKLDYCYPLKRYPLHVEIFAESFDYHFKYGMPSNLGSVDFQRIVDCIYQIHQTMHESEVREELRRIDRRYDNQKEAILTLINRLFDCYSKLLVLRVDLSYRSDYQTSLPQAKQHMDHFVEYLRKSQEDLLGYVWKLEYGLKKEYHFHVLVFLDGQAARSDVFYARSLGEQWQNVITNNKGLYYNCHAEKKYPECYLGLVQHDQTEENVKRNWLEKHALYLAKPDLVIEIAKREEARQYQEKGQYKLERITRYAREFGTSRLPPLPETRRGRPRRL